MKLQKNSFAALGFDDSSSENEEEMNNTPVQMTIWGPAIGHLNWAEEMEREEMEREEMEREEMNNPQEEQKAKKRLPYDAEYDWYGELIHPEYGTFW